jgi:hypothetical protein
MSEIKSPLGNKSFASPGQRRVLTVSDDSWEDIPQKQAPASQERLPYAPQVPGQQVELTVDQFNEMQAKRQEIRAMQKKPSSESKLRAEILTGIGRLTSDITIEGYKFTIRSLKAKEMSDIIKHVAQIAISAEALYEMRAQTLARCISKIDDQPIGLVLGGDDLSTLIEFINDSEEHIVNRLYTAYTEMTKANEDKFSIADAKDAQEVAAEIKK